MQKQELYALIDRLYLDQEKYNKFIDYTFSFTRQPRCKKGGIAFVEEVFNLPEIAGKDELAIRLLSEKTTRNSRAIEDFIMSHPVTAGYSQALIDARKLVMSKVAEYVLDTAKRIHDTNLEDKSERQVYLRRAVARLCKLFVSSLPTSVEASQWHEVEPYEWTEYLSSTLEELVFKIEDPKTIQEWSNTYQGANNLSNLNLLRSLNTYLDYLDTFVEF